MFPLHSFSCGAAQRQIIAATQQWNMKKKILWKQNEQLIEKSNNPIVEYFIYLPSRLYKSIYLVG